MEGRSGSEQISSFSRLALSSVLTRVCCIEAPRRVPNMGGGRLVPPFGQVGRSSEAFVRLWRPDRRARRLRLQLTDTKRRRRRLYAMQRVLVTPLSLMSYRCTEIAWIGPASPRPNL